jgi:hypothetical protein
MEFSLTFKVNEHIYLRNPESSDLGKKILKHSIDLIYEIGFEQFTFKKLAAVAETTEASIIDILKISKSFCYISLIGIGVIWILC